MTVAAEELTGAGVKAFPRLFEPFELRGVWLRNRIVFLPHVTMYGEHGRPTRQHRFYFEERARGGAGLIVSESQVVHPTGGHGRCVLTDENGMRGWRETIDAVHEHGCRFFAQLTHHGPEAFTTTTMLPQWAPSPVADPAVGEIPKQMSHAEIREAQAAYRAGAGRAVAVGFDGVELKVGHDGLLRTFLTPFYNRRDDEYGLGSVEDRLRFVVETLEGVRMEIGDVPLGIRFCLDEHIPGGYGLDEGLAIVAELAATGLLDYVSADMGTWVSVEMQVPPAGVPEGYADEATAAARKVTGLPTIAFGRIVSPGHAETILESGGADLVGMARQLLADPEWPLKVAEGRADDIRLCIHCNQECVGRLMRNIPISCIHNPAAGREERLGARTRTAAAHARRVVVVGGGPAGLKAAEIAAARGHECVVLEREPVVGGQVALAARAPHNEEWGEIVHHLARRLERLGVELRTGVEATAATVLAERPDAVVLATGSRPAPPPFPADGMRVLDGIDVLRGDLPRGERVVLLDLAHRYEGAALADTLAAAGNDVQWLTPAPAVMIDMDWGTRRVVLRRLAAAGLRRDGETTVVGADAGGVTVLNVGDGSVRRIEAVGCVVVAGCRAADTSLAAALGGDGPELRTVGDCVAPRHVAIAIYEGELAGRAL